MPVELRYKIMNEAISQQGEHLSAVGLETSEYPSAFSAAADRIVGNLEKIEDLHKSGAVSTQQYGVLLNEFKTKLENAKIEETYTVQYKKLRDFIAHMISEIDLGTIAHSSIYDFSFAWHEHDEYSYVSYLPNASPNASSLIAIMTTTTGEFENQLSICLPDVIVPVTDSAEIGEYKFVALKSRTSIDVNSPEFDGWVYADGSSYLKAQFPRAYEVFNPTHSPATTFVVPNIDSFVKLNGFSTASVNSFDKVKYKNAMSPHVHKEFSNDQLLNYSKVNKVTAQMPYNFSHASNTAATAFHTGFTKKSGSSKLDGIKITINANEINSSATETLALNQDTESTPRHVVIPLMTYIGKPIV